MENLLTQWAEIAPGLAILAGLFMLAAYCRSAGRPTRWSDRVAQDRGWLDTRRTASGVETQIGACVVMTTDSSCAEGGCSDGGGGGD